ncbi:MAG: selenide, water dikinase SelD [Deltaproteobacteria bacterium]|nr:selenide, water dikinase SelD [Deltaproteobacteria bacterium]
MSPVGLGELLASLPKNEDPNLLVGFSTSDDAAVYRLSGETALVMTADIITPPVDDPHLFGQIAAANALSDVFAMGGKPLACLNLIGFPADKLGPEVLHGMVAGALTKVTEAGAVLAGGHTTEDEEPKMGLSVTGVVHPDKVWTNAGAQPGDALVMTKPIGSGVLFNANLKGWVSTEALDTCIAWITTLNKRAAEIMSGFEIHAATDITGFGLAGHCLEVAEGSEASLRIDIDAIPVMDEALAVYQRGMTTGVNAVNRQLVESKWRFERELPFWHQEIFIDPQTSGPLLAAVPPEQADDLVAALQDSGIEVARRVGTVEPFDGRSRLIFE